MKQTYLKKAFRLFAAYKASKLSSDDLEIAESKAAHLEDKISDFKLLLNMSRDIMAGKYKANPWNVSVIVATIAYVVSPLDAIPDLVPVLGWLDDVTIVGYALGKLSEEIKRYKTHIATAE